MKKVSILIYSLGNGGAERVVSILLNEFQNKYDITLVLMNDTISYDIPKTIKKYYLENSSPFENGLIKFLKLPFLGYKYKKFCQKNNIDVSLSLMNRPVYIAIFAKIFGLNIRNIISERSTPSMIYSNNSLQSIINKYLIKWLYNKADKVIANSNGNSLDLLHNFKVKSEVIYNPIKKPICEYEKDVIKSFVFISIGRVDKGKNQKLLIDAFEKANLRAELWIIGDGALREELEQYAGNKVKFLGSKKDVFKFLAKADCFVFGSNYEGFPNVLLEALACNLPIISTDCKSGPREILAPNTKTDSSMNIELARFGILTKVGCFDCMIKAMKLIYNDKERRYNYQLETKNAIKRFELEKILLKWESVIDEL